MSRTGRLQGKSAIITDAASGIPEIIRSDGEFKG